MAYTPSAPLDATTLNARFRVKTEPLAQRSVAFAGLQGAGRVTFNNSGEYVEWRPEIRQRTISSSDPYKIRREFPSRNVWIKCQLGWCTYNLGERIAKIDRLANRGDARFINLVERVTDGIAKSFMADFKKKLYIDGSSNPEDLQGLESVYSVSGLVSGSYCGNPNGTYAGHSQALGALGGSWSGTWPHLGTGTTDYYAWSPMVVDVQAALWATNYSEVTSAVWKQTWRYALNYLWMNLARVQDMEPDVCLMHTDWLRQAEDSLATTEKFEVTNNSYLTKLGHRTLNFKGLELAHEYAIPDETAYVFSWDNIELKSMQGQLFGFDSEKNEIRTTDDLYAADFFGQLVIEIPGFMGKLDVIS